MSNVSSKKQEELQKRMMNLKLKESEIVEKFVRSSGAGGQHLNKSSTCVYLKHLPTGIEVKCSQERSQALNRFLARRVLVNKVEQLILGRKSQERQKIEKIRRQKRKRSKRSKEKILKAKHHVSEKKKLRGRITDGF